jgi:hypothetical protein
LKSLKIVVLLGENVVGMGLVVMAEGMEGRVDRVVLVMLLPLLLRL